MVNVSATNDPQSKSVLPKKAACKATSVKKPTHLYLNDKCITDLVSIVHYKYVCNYVVTNYFFKYILGELTCN